MTVEGILTSIRAEADDEIRRVRDAGAAAAAAARAAAEQRALEAERTAAASRDLAAEREEARIVSRAHLDADRMMRATVEAAYQEALGLVRERLGSLRRSEEYRDVLARLLDEALDALPDATIIRSDPADLTLVRSLVAERRSEGLVVEASMSTDGGVEVATDDGRWVQNTLEARLVRADPRLRCLAARHLPPREAT